MKKKFFLFIYTIFIIFNFYAQETFIQIPMMNGIIGNNKFSYIDKFFTGIAGEEGTGKIKYKCKEHSALTSAYQINKYLVTNKEFNKFRQITGYKSSYEREYDLSGDVVMLGFQKEDFPVRNISFRDAVAYSQWLSEIDEENDYRLPTNAEWEFAAIDETKNLYPWGNENKVLLSTNTDDIKSRYDYSIYDISEDKSSYGMCNLMGGFEYLLDTYENDIYDKVPEKNPLSLGSFDFFSRGGPLYNDLYESMGLFSLGAGCFDSRSRDMSFRLVKDNNNIFNENTSEECVYFVNRGVSANKTINIYNHLNSEEKEVVEPIGELFVIFKTTDNNYLRVFYYKNGKNFLGTDTFFLRFGWVKSEDVILNNKKWYEK